MDANDALVSAKRRVALTTIGIAVAALFVEFLLADTSFAQVQRSDTAELNNARQAWRARQEKTESAIFTFVTEVKYPAGSSLHPQRMASRLSRRNRGKPLDPDEQTPELVFETHIEVKLVGEKIRVYHEGPPAFQPDENWPLNGKSTTLEVFDGYVGVTLTTSTVKGRFPRASFRRPEHFLFRPDAIYWPLLTQIRAFDTRLHTFPAGKLIDTERIEEIGDSRCLIFRSGPDHFQTEYRVDPAMDYCIRRKVLLAMGRVPLFQVDISYQKDDQFGWVPSGWVSEHSMIESHGFDPEVRYVGVGSVTKARVTSYEFNVPIDDKEFQIDFPVGTLVFDERLRAAGLRDDGYIVRPNGEKRVILPEESGKGFTYEQLRDSEPGELLPLRAAQ